MDVEDQAGHSSAGDHLELGGDEHDAVQLHLGEEQVVHTCDQPGCYKIEFAVFVRKRPTIQVVVNNEPILSAMSGGVAPALYVAPKGPASGCYFG